MAASGPVQPADALAASPLGASLAGLMASGTPSQRKLADHILRHPLSLFSSSIEDLAQAASVSAPTISRFARALDMAGFAELRAGVAAAMQSAMDPVAKLKLQLDKADRQAGGAEMLDAMRRQLMQLDAAMVGAQITDAARRLAVARFIHVMGFGLSAHVAALLVLGLQPFRPSTSGVVEFGGTEVAAGRLMGIGPGDVLVSITFPRYAEDVVRLTRYARDRGAEVIALTDGPASPLAALADLALFVPAQHPTLPSSMVAAVAIVETLVAAVMLSDPAHARNAALLGEAIGAYLHGGARNGAARG